MDGDQRDEILSQLQAPRMIHHGRKIRHSCKKKPSLHFAPLPLEIAAQVIWSRSNTNNPSGGSNFIA